MSELHFVPRSWLQRAMLHWLRLRSSRPRRWLASALWSLHYPTSAQRQRTKEWIARRERPRADLTTEMRLLLTDLESQKKKIDNVIKALRALLKHGDTTRASQSDKPEADTNG
jgi:hypothetical protein